MIYTKRFILVPFCGEYTEDLFELWKEEEVVRYTNIPVMKRSSQAKERIINVLEEKTDWDCINHFVVRYEGKTVGIAGFPIISCDKSYDGFRCGLYYQFARKYWGKGFATEVVKALLEYIEENHKKPLVYADTVSENLGSQIVLERNGFIRNYVESQAFYRDGTGFDVIHYEKHLRQ